MSRTSRTPRMFTLLDRLHNSCYDRLKHRRKTIQKPLCYLEEMMLQKISAHDFRKMFIREHRKENQQDLARHFRSYLRAAVEHNHAELIARLKVDLPADLQFSNEAPLLFTFREGDVTLFEVFVPYKESLPLEGTDMMFVRYMGKLYCCLSAVEYACLLDGVDTISLLRFLVVFDESMHLKRLLHPTEKNALEPELSAIETLCPRTTVLHMVMFLMDTLLNATRQLPLPSIVEALIKAGASVDCRYSSIFNDMGKTAFNFFIFKVVQNIRRGVIISVMERQMILATVRLLLTAGSEIDDSINGVFGDLLRLTWLYDPHKEMLFEISVSTVSLSPFAGDYRMPKPANQFPLIVDLFNVIISHNPDCVARQVDYVTKTLLSILQHIAQRVDGLDSSQNVNDAMDDYTDIFRCLANAIANANLGRTFTFVKEIPFSFLESFGVISYYALQSGASKKLVRLVLNSLSAIQVRQLEESLSKDDLELDKRGRDASLAWIRGMESTTNLQHLARRAMSRSRHFDTIALYPHLQPYILFNADERRLSD